MPPITAVALVTQRLRRLKSLSPEAYAAVMARIQLLARDPADPRARGVTRKAPGGPLVRSVVVSTPDLLVGLTWILVGDEIRILSLEYDGADD